MRDVTLGEDKVLVSFDVSSLFTNVPIGVVVQVHSTLCNPARPNYGRMMVWMRDLQSHHTGQQNWWTCV